MKTSAARSEEMKIYLLIIFCDNILERGIGRICCVI